MDNSASAKQVSYKAIDSIMPDAVAGNQDGIGRIMYLIAISGPVMTIPQIVKMWMEKSAAGVSLMTWISYAVLAVFWLHHGYRRKDKPLFVSYVLWIVVDLMVIAGILMYG